MLPLDWIKHFWKAVLETHPLLQDTKEATEEGEEVDDDPLEKFFAKRGEKQHKSGKKKVVST